MLEIEDIRVLCKDENILLTEHLLSRMRQRNIGFKDIKQAIMTGEIIEQYPTDYPFPSCLINSDSIHIVCSIGDEHLYLITAYHPSPEQWEDGGKKRKEKKT